MCFVNFSSAHAAVEIFIGKKLGIFNEVVRKIEAAGIYVPQNLWPTARQFQICPNFIWIRSDPGL